MSRYVKVRYGDIVKILIKIYRFKGQDYPLTETLKALERRKNISVDRSKVVDMLRTKGFYKETVEHTKCDTLKVTCMVGKVEA